MLIQIRIDTELYNKFEEKAIENGHYVRASNSIEDSSMKVTRLREKILSDALSGYVGGI